MGDREPYKNSELPCSGECWHYGVFGGVQGCEAVQTPWPEPIEPGQKCLYPNKRDICPGFIMTEVGLCAALEGAVIEGGPHDNTQLVKILTGAKSK